MDFLNEPHIGYFMLFMYCQDAVPCFSYRDSRKQRERLLQKLISKLEEKEEEEEAMGTMVGSFSESWVKFC